MVLRIASLLLVVWSFSAFAWRELECFPPVILNQLPSHLTKHRAELSLDWSGLPYIRRHKDYQSFIEYRELGGGDLNRLELSVTLDRGEHRFETQILPKFHRHFDAHLVYMGGQEWEQFMRSVPAHHPYHELFRDGALVFMGPRSAYILSRNYLFLSICVPLPRERTRASFDQMLGQLFRFMASPTISGFLSCEGVLAGLKERT